MANEKTLAKILATVCFECCHTDHKTGGLGLLCRPAGRHPELGETVNADGKCKACPIAVLRGDKAPISSGKRSTVFKNQLVPGDDCVGESDWLTADDLSLPCRKCEHATVTEKGARLKDIAYCAFNCPAWEIQGILLENEAEASMS